MIDTRKKLGVRLFQLRTEVGMTQVKLAQTAGLSVDSIRSIERGDGSPRMESLEKIAKALRVDAAELLNFGGREFRALAEGPPECLDLWNLLKNKKRGQAKKVYELAKIVLS